MQPELIAEIPGPKSHALAAQLRRYESRNITCVTDDWPIFWERAVGTNVWDADGNRFLDFTSAFGVAGLGHGNADIGAAIRRQSAQLWHAMGDVHPSALKAELCATLSALTFERWGADGGKTILGNSGFEAVEAALKTALLHSGKRGVIAFQGAYHGLGYGALAAGGLPFFREPFRGQLADFATLIPYPHCYRCPFGVTEAFRTEGEPFPNCSSTCLAELSDKIERVIEQREIGCILVEPIQGRGGLIPPPRDFMQLLRRVCDTHKILLIVDEIFTGLNRTGALFASDHFGVVPDLICLGKALTSGFPLSACVGRADLMDAWPESTGEALHTSTFLGNPLGCAMALASLKQHADPALAPHVRERGAVLRKALKSIRSPFIGEVRGVGLMLGVELINAAGQPDGERAARVLKNALRAGLILLADGPSGNVLSFTPPFQVSDEEIEFAAALITRLLESNAV